MKKGFYQVMGLTVLLLMGPGFSFAEAGKKTGGPDISGSWNYKTSNHKVVGSCPVGTPTSGKLTLQQKDSHVTLVFDSGMICNPATICTYEGKRKDERVSLTNATVGPEYLENILNGLHLSFQNGKTATGKVISRHIYGDGQECDWRHDIQLSR